VLSTTVK